VWYVPLAYRLATALVICSALFASGVVMTQRSLWSVLRLRGQTRGDGADGLFAKYLRLLRFSLVGVLMVGCTEPVYGTSGLDAGSDGSGEWTGDARPSDVGPIVLGKPDAKVSEGSEAAVDEPQSPHDAGALDAPDAGMVVAPPVGPAALLLGRYAMRRRYFGRSSLGSTLGTFVEESIALVDITPHEIAGKLKMTYQQCNAWTNVTSGVYSNIVNRPLFPVLPPRVLDVVVIGDTFHTEGPPHLIGYTSAAPGCTAGAKLAALDKPWITSGMCTCASSSAPPTQEDDCRVSDEDGDKLAGITTRSSGGGLSGSEQRLRIREVSQYVNGVIAPDRRHSARFEVARDEHTFKCVGGCMTWGVVGCPADRNQVFLELLPANEPFDCASLASAVDEFRVLANPKPVNPTDC
jgi:hypothetical protein